MILWLRRLYRALRGCPTCGNDMIFYGSTFHADYMDVPHWWCSSCGLVLTHHARIDGKVF